MKHVAVAMAGACAGESGGVGAVEVGEVEDVLESTPMARDLLHAAPVF